MDNTLTDIPGLRVGHAQNVEALTGCTVILCEAGAVGGVDQRGGAPGTRETDLLRPLHLVEKVHAILLAGGSAFGLDAATGVMRYLEERGVGYDTGVARVPLVPGAILFDLGVGNPHLRPDAAMGYQACQNASTAPVAQGNVGAGTGATVGKILGMGQAMKAGLGTASIAIGGGLIVGALVAVNALGDVVDPETGRILAGVRTPIQPIRETDPDPAPSANTPPFADTRTILRMLAASPMPPASPDNTVIGVVATNARLTKEQTNKVAQMAHDGLARAIRPAHMMYDGDTIFALATGEVPADVNVVGSFAAEVFAQAIVEAVLSAKSVAGLPATRDFYGGGPLVPH
ncbi:MAG: P1 family peptidase [Anaerolineales bacterium]|nr:P1 family peptidase [Anaerolineales bacterium]